MARPLRIEFAGALYHVTSRGDGQDKIFLGDKDRDLWLNILGHICERFNWVVHAYCQMGNHYHILIETPDGNLSKGMRQLNGVYTQRFNRIHHRVGHVFQGRYKAILVQKDAYLLELSRYIVLNPVRAHRVRSARDWPWSNYRATAGMTAAPKWLETDWILAAFAERKKEAQTAISNERLIDQNEGRVHFRYRDYAHGNKMKVLALGTKEFIRRFQLHIPPKHFTRVRGCGLLANRDRKRRPEKAAGKGPRGARAVPGAGAQTTEARERRGVHATGCGYRYPSVLPLLTRPAARGGDSAADPCPPATGPPGTESPSMEAQR
jgi:REP element-mobilizing transposase RayT